MKTNKPIESNKFHKINWEHLFDEWMIVGMPNKYTFLAEKGLNPKSEICQRQMAFWEKGIAKVLDNVTLSHREYLEIGGKTPANATSWEIIQRFREAQARADFRRANMLAKHVENQIAQGWEEVTTRDPATLKEVVEYRSTIPAVKLNHLATTIEKIQRIQRLALGLSTDNLGVADPTTTETHVEQDKKESKGPVFIVETTESGKFKAPKPKRVE